MDEEQNNNEQNLGEKINDGVQDTKNAVKDGANLGKNVATGNVLGAIKDGFKLLGNKTVRKTILIAILIPIIVIVMLASSIYAIFDGIGSKVQDVISKIENLFTVDWDNGNGAITISDEAIDEIIATIESTGVDLADLKLMGDVEDNAIDKESEEYKEVLRKYIRKFYEAQVVTETLNTNPGWFEEYILNGGKTYGAVYVYRPKDVEIEETVENLEKDQLKYMSYEKMQEKATNGKINDIKGYFSVKDGKLVIPEWITTTVSKSKSKSTNITLNTNITLREIEYKSLITQYTTPMNFFIYLAMVSQNPEFVAAVTELVKGSEIHITVLDTETTNIEDEIYTYTTHTKGSSVSYEDITDDYGIVINTKKVVTPINTSSNEEENTKTTITTVIPTVKVTHVKTWFCEQDITYVKKELEPYHDSYVLDSSNDATLADDPEPAEPPEGSTVSWITDRKKDITVDTTGTTYEEGIRGDVVDKTDDFIKLLDIKYKLPNTNRYEAAGINNMVGGAEMLFSLMQKDSGLQNLEQVMRYVLGKYANKDFGVDSLDGSGLFEITDFSSVSQIQGGTTEDKFWYALKSLGYSDEAICGAMGNIKQESGFKTTALNSSSGAYGISQWMGGRLDSLKNYANSKSTTEEDEIIQIEFLIAEITGKGNAKDYANRRTAGGKGELYHTYDEWASAKTVEEAAVYYCWFFETPSTSSVENETTKKEEEKRIKYAKEYYEKYKGRGTGGSYTTNQNGGYGVKGYYTSSTGRKFTILNQNSISGWSDKCNRAASAIIASGYSNKSSMELISDINNKYDASIYSAIPSTAKYWSHYGLKVSHYEQPGMNYQTKLKEQLTSGGYALLWLNNNKSTYKGKSGIVWTKKYHWIAVIDYKQEGNTMKIAVADYSGINWVGLDEFSTHGVTNMVFISEK